MTFPIHEPVTEWSITLTVISPARDAANPAHILNTFKFKTVAELRSYLFDNYNIAKSLGYDVPIPGPEKMTTLTGRISFTYKDRYRAPTFEFTSARDFAAFLDLYPPLAAVVKYKS